MQILSGCPMAQERFQDLSNPGEKGYDIKPVILYQDDKFAIALMEKGRFTSISIRYFFFKGRINTEDVKLVYMIIKDMLAVFIQNCCQGVYFVE